MSGLTTHVLDTMRGQPASGLSLRLRRGGETLVEAITNLDGRVDKPLLTAATLTPGTYRLEFDVGEYFRDLGVALPDPAFLETVVIDFGIADPTAHYHVPLLVSPYAYSTYRGS
ncbi:hydroxyisourate hydrolase [Phenylobacterium sp.]|uniref:hydroxyisourate hydrolase n=1 Tax=Phenylobacterium sp. TaxID=1871053 RepID=UPI001228028A|nr:hydroxyisourate hydrolase [Phenylobacterium sp.]TAL38229.1 MAG: hydroxyisourate hydrolase [Phenylobacterium sp.]